MPHFISEAVIEEAADAIISARDFCGDEHEAVADVCADRGIKGADRVKVRRIANFRANARWNRFKREAGVSERHLW